MVSTCRKVLVEAEGEAEFSFAPVDCRGRETLMPRITLSPDLLHWYERMAPLTFWFWWANQFYLHDPRTLRGALVGYRWDEDELEFEEGDWSPDWVLIGEWGADPVIAHVDEPGTPVSMAMHGIGEWDLKRVAPDLASFLTGMSVWLEVFFVRWKGKYEAEDCRTLPQVLEELNGEIRTVLAEEFARYWPWGTAY